MVRIRGSSDTDLSHRILEQAKEFMTVSSQINPQSHSASGVSSAV